MEISTTPSFSIIDEAARPPSTTPFGVRLSISGQGEKAMIVTWSTTAPLSSLPCVEYAIKSYVPFDRKQKSASTPSNVGVAAESRSPLNPKNPKSSTLLCGTAHALFEDVPDQLPHYVHIVSLDIVPGLYYEYRCGNDVDGWSRYFVFRANQGSDQGTSRMVFLGDLGVSHALTLPSIETDVLQTGGVGDYGAVHHVGDLGYDLAHLRGGRAMQFLESMENVTASLPYMVSPGNHEAALNFSHFRLLYSMPMKSRTENLYYSYDIGPVHVLSYNTEVFFWPESWNDSYHMQSMYDWMEVDLAAASASRDTSGPTKWVVVVGHRPMYCARAARATSHCTWEQEASRRGLPSTCPHNNPHACHVCPLAADDKHLFSSKRERQAWPIEDLLQKYDVDVAIFGHVHDYERYCPVYNYSCRGQRKKSPPHSKSKKEDSVLPLMYTDPAAPVHVTVGGAGNPEMRIGPGLPPQGPCAANAPWCGFQSGFAPGPHQGHDFSYGRAAFNATHMHWQQVSVTFNRIIDEWWIQKSHQM